MTFADKLKKMREELPREEFAKRIAEIAMAARAQGLKDYRKLKRAKKA